MQTLDLAVDDSPAAQGPGILIVEDAAILGMDLVDILVLRGFTDIVWVRSGREAVAACSQRTFDVAIFDLTLVDGQTGGATAAVLSDRITKLIVFSGCSAAVDELSGIPHVFVPKTAPPEALIELVEAVPVNRIRQRG